MGNASLTSYACNSGFCSGDPANPPNCGSSLKEVLVSCTTPAECASAAAAECDKLPGCQSFGLCPIWSKGIRHVKLFQRGTESLTENDAWNVWVKKQRAPLEV